MQLYLRETIERGLFDSQRCYKFAITKAERGKRLQGCFTFSYYLLLLLRLLRLFPVRNY